MRFCIKCLLLLHALSAPCKAGCPCRFHGIEPSKKSKEKAQQKQRDEMAAKKLATSEQPTGSFNHLKNAQVIVPYILLCLLPNGAFSIPVASGSTARLVTSAAVCMSILLARGDASHVSTRSQVFRPFTHLLTA